MTEEPTILGTQEAIDTDVGEFPQVWQRAVLPLRLLTELGKGPNYGYAVAASMVGHGFSRVKGATLYPALSKLELDGFLSTSWEDGQGGPGRKVYQLTEQGREELQRLEHAWSAFHVQVTGR
ncbi:MULTISPECIES: PadR family transcriptional regulator [unclassified Arthrobacter]|uniref:PadR family transcriptional regulator n=1 Tax=unclassified Arthrobacter TaxID=235627 RepID=UPI000CE51DB6|nr:MULTISPECIES: PadR family transcriptional regulator [unclassified Arthrobacter]